MRQVAAACAYTARKERRQKKTWKDFQFHRAVIMESGIGYA
jgi:hypothetical protein